MIYWEEYLPAFVLENNRAFKHVQSSLEKKVNIG